MASLEVDSPRLVNGRGDSYLCVHAEFGAGDESGLHWKHCCGEARGFSVDDSSGGDAGDQGGVDYGGGEDGVEVRGSAGTSDAAGLLKFFLHQRLTEVRKRIL